MSATTWVALVCGLVGALLASIIAHFAGRFWTSLYRFDDPAGCSQDFFHPGQRWRVFYLPICLLTALAMWVMPHWLLSAIVLLAVAWSLKLGARRTYHNHLQRCIDYHLEFGANPEQARALAKRDVNDTVRLMKLRSRIR
jgi:hypothetical protein